MDARHREEQDHAGLTRERSMLRGEGQHSTPGTHAGDASARFKRLGSRRPHPQASRFLVRAECEWIEVVRAACFSNSPRVSPRRRPAQGRIREGIPTG